MTIKKFGKTISVDRLAEMVGESLLRIEEKMVTKDDVREIVREEMDLVLDKKFEEKLAPIHKKLDNNLYHHEKRIEKLEERTVILKNVITQDLEVQVSW